MTIKITNEVLTDEEIEQIYNTTGFAYPRVLSRTIEQAVLAKVQPELKECRHCGWLCAPHESNKWHPLAPAAQQAVNANASVSQDAVRLGFILRHLSGDVLRNMVGEMSCTSDIDEFREAIDAARSRVEGES